MRKAQGCLLLTVMMGLSVLSAADAAKSPTADERPRIYIHAFKTAESFSLPEKRQSDVDSRSVALGKSYLTGRLVKPGRPFAVVSEEKGATHDLIPVVSFLRSRENTFKGATYGVETKTTKWLLDVILTLRDRATGEVAWAKTVCGMCEEQRPISDSQFDNNIFHSLMIAAVEEAAEELVSHFEPPEDDAASDLLPDAGVVAGRASGTGAGAAPAERPALAILRPDFRDGVTENEAVMLWAYMESCVDGSAYRVISRADVARQMEEVAITTSSYLTDPACREKARVGKLATVSRLLAAAVGRVGGKYVMTLKVFNASTAEIETSRTGQATADALEELLPLLKGKMTEVLAPAPSGTVLAPVQLRLASPPKYFLSEFSVRLETALADAGIAYRTGSGGARVLTPTVQAFSVRAVAEGGGHVYRGSLAFALALTDVTGKALARPVVVTLQDVDLGTEAGAAPPWLTERYGKKLLDRAFDGLAGRFGALK